MTADEIMVVVVVVVMGTWLSSSSSIVVFETETLGIKTGTSWVVKSGTRGFRGSSIRAMRVREIADGGIATDEDDLTLML